ncbi:MAG TPA: hypothetical protein VJB92_00825 [Candidatus Paceibacterota bacterium]
MESSRISIVKTAIPEEIKAITEALAKNKFQAYLVGGCARDILIGRELFLP